MDAATTDRADAFNRVVTFIVENFDTTPPKDVGRAVAVANALAAHLHSLYRLGKKHGRREAIEAFASAEVKRIADLMDTD